MVYGFFHANCMPIFYQIMVHSFAHGGGSGLRLNDGFGRSWAGPNVVRLVVFFLRWLKLVILTAMRPVQCFIIELS